MLAEAGMAAFTLISAAQQAETIRGNAELTRMVDDLNAQYIDIDAYNAEKMGYTQAARYDSQVRQTISAERAGYAANNVDVNFGTAKDVQQENKLNGMLNKLDIINQAQGAAQGLKLQARNLRLQGVTGTSQSNYQASATMSGAVLNAVSTGISGYTKKPVSNSTVNNYYSGGGE